jgi:hypothetical protein
MLSPSEIRLQITRQIVEALTKSNPPPWRKPLEVAKAIQPSDSHL